jgi:hypothetical protein
MVPRDRRDVESNAETEGWVTGVAMLGQSWLGTVWPARSGKLRRVRASQVPARLARPCVSVLGQSWWVWRGRRAEAGTARDGAASKCLSWFVLAGALCHVPARRGGSRFVLAWLARHRMSRRVSSRYGPARLARLGALRHGPFWCGSKGLAWYGLAGRACQRTLRPGRSRHIRAGSPGLGGRFTSRLGLARQCMPRLGSARLGRHVSDGYGTAGCGEACPVMAGVVRHRTAWTGLSGLGDARLRTAGRVSPVLVGLVAVRLGWRGLLAHVRSRHCEERRGRLGPSCLVLAGTAWSGLARQSWCVAAGHERQGLAGLVGKARPGGLVLAWRGMARPASQVWSCKVLAGLGIARPGWRGEDSHVLVTLVMARRGRPAVHGEATRGLASHGVAGKSRRSASGMMRRSVAGQACRGPARPVWERLGITRQSGLGMAAARLGPSRFVSAGPDRLVPSWNAKAGSGMAGLARLAVAGPVQSRRGRRV